MQERSKKLEQSAARQRQPALLIQSTYALLSSPARQQSTINTVSIGNQRQQKNGNNNYWNSNYPSESEFDTTRLNCYLNALNRKGRGRSELSGASGQHAKQRQSHHIRSRSVDAPLNRLRMSIHKPVGSILTAISSAAGAKLASSGNPLSNECDSSSRAVLVTRSESLNSEGSSLSGESGICDFGTTINNPAKSVLKKGSPNESVQLCSHGKKNVTFSAYATIQVMDDR